MLVVSTQGEAMLLDAATGRTAATPWTLRLFANDHTPATVDTEADYIEAVGGGYVAIALNAAAWTTSAGAPTSTAQPRQRFTFNGPLTTNPSVYGYYVTAQDGRQVYAERLGAPLTPVDGAQLDVTPQLTLRNQGGGG